MAAGSAVVNFSDTATGQVAGQIPFSVVAVTFGAELLYNSVSVTIAGGTPQTALDTTYIANYGVRQLTLSGLLLEDDAQAADLATYLVDKYKLPVAVVTQIRVPLDKLSSGNRTTVAGMDIGNTVTFNWTPTASLGAVSETLAVEGVGYEKDIDGAAWMTFQLAPAPDNDFFILDNDTDNYSGASILDNDTDTQANAGILGF